MSVDKLQRGQVKLLELLQKQYLLQVEQAEEIKELKQLFLNKWKMEDEQYGEYRWPYDQDGDILSNVSMSRRLN